MLLQKIHRNENPYDVMGTHGNNKCRHAVEAKSTRNVIEEDWFNTQWLPNNRYREDSTSTVDEILSQKTKQDALEFLWIWEQFDWRRTFCLFKTPYKNYSEFVQRTIRNIRIFP